MPSVSETRKLLRDHDALEARVAADRAAEARRERDFSAIQFALKMAETQGLEPPSVPETTPAYFVEIDRRRKGVEQLAAIAERIWELKNKAAKGNLEGRMLEVLVADARTRRLKTLAAAKAWNGAAIRQYTTLVFDYVTDSLLAGIGRADTFEALGTRFVLGDLISSAMSSDAEDGIVPIAQDEDGRLLLNHGWQIHEATYDDIDWKTPAMKADVVRNLLAAQDVYLEPIVDEIMKGIAAHGGEGAWHGDEQVAVSAFAPDWQYRPSALTVQLMNVVHWRTSKPEDRPTAPYRSGDPAAPYSADAV